MANIYSTASPLIQMREAWIADPDEADRIAAYQLYEDIYWTVPETFKLAQRGSDESPIYIPSGRIMVETLHRYLANDMEIIVDPMYGSENEQALAMQVMNDLTARERFYSKFAANKRYGIIRGDWLWHVYADLDREPGSRISIFPLDPANYFPIYNEDNIDEIIGCHIVTVQTTNDDKQQMHRLTYRKVSGVGGPSAITVEEGIYEIDAWGGPGDQDETVVAIIRPPTLLPQPIDHIPVYHIPHFEEPNVLYGSSEMRGLERVMAAIDQGISDEELSLVLDGVGVYATNAGAPIDPDTGQDLPWNLGPGRVVEIPTDAMFERVSGTTTVAPFQSHLAYLHDQLDGAAGQPSVAKGTVDVTVAESGVALMIQLGPMLSRAKEKEQIVTDKHRQFFYDIAKWYVAYEGTSFNSLMETTRWMPIYGSKIPQNRAELFNEIMETVKSGIMPMRVAWSKLRELGMDLPEDSDMEAQLIQEKAAMAAVEMQALADQIDTEINNDFV